MAYGLKYTQYIEKGGALVRINVYEKDWTGGSYGMAHVVGASLQIIGGQSNVIAPIIKTAFSFSLVDAYDEGTPNSDGTTCINPDGEKCGQWEEFFTPDATKYKVEVTSKPAPGASESVIWTGFITPDSWSENMIYRGVITVTARDMIGALQEKEFDLTGRVSVRDLIAGAMSACECPMQLQLTEAHFLANSNGNSILDHTFAASVFAGDTWYQALEDTLDSLGLVLRYNGANRIVLTSLRYIAGDTTRGSHEIEFVSRSGLRQLDPAIRSITETFDASLVRLAVDDPDPSQYTATGEYNVQRAPCSSSLPHDVNIPRYTLTGQIQPTAWLGSLAVPRPTQIYQGGGAIPEREIYFPTDIITEGVSATVQTHNIKAPFSFRINQDGPVMRYQVNGATTIVSALAKFQDIALSKIHVVVQASVDGQARYLGADGAWSTAQTIHEIDPGAEVVVPALSGGESFSIIITKLDTAYTGDWQLPVSTVVALNVELSPAQSSTTPTEFKTTTEYDQANNVVITRKPKIGSAGISSSAPFAENVLAYGDDLAADEWNWPGEESYYPLAVMIQAQVLCYYSAPASIFTGTAHDKAADVAAALPGYMFEYYDRDGVILSGTYGFTAGFISQINAREVYGWEDVWGAGFNPEYTAQSGAGKGSTSATGPGGGSASSGGASSTPAVGLNYFEPNEDRASIIQLKPAYDYLGPRKGLVFGRSSSEDVNVDLEVVNIAGAGEEPVYALHSKLPFYSDSFVSAGGISDGPGSTGIDLAAMWASLQNLDSVHTYDSYLIASAHIPDMSSVYGYLKQADIDPILALVPAQASATNQLADKAFVNSSIATATSTYRGNYNEYSDLNLNPSATHAQVATKLGTVISEADANDYCFVEIPTSASTPTQIERTERYKYNGTGWEYEYTLNNSGFTAVQWAAINSNITADKVSAYDTLVGYFSNGVLEDTHLPAMYIGDAPVKFSAQTAQDVGGLGNLTMANAKYLRGYGRDGSTIYNLIGISQGTVSSRPVDLLIIGSTEQASETDPYLARTYLRGRELYLQTGDGVNSSALVLSATQNATFYGAVYIQNNRSIWWKNKPAEGANEISISLMALTSSNVFALGSGLIATGNNARAYGTYLYGASLSFYTGTATTGAVRRWMINSSGNLYPYADKSYNLGAAANYIKEAYIGKMFLAPGVYLEVDSNGYVHLSGEGFYCDGFVSAGGLSSGGGSAGVDLAAVWGSLIENAGEGYGKRIHTAHLPDVTITGQNVTGSASYSGTGGASSALTLTINVPTAVTSLGGKTGDITLGSGLSIDSNKVLSNSGVRSVSVSGDYLRVNTGGTNADLTVPYATNAPRFKRYDGTLNVQGGYDLNTLLAGGGITSQYNLSTTWGNAPTDMSFGGAVQLNPLSAQTLAMQLAWDVDHTNVKTGHLWWRDSIYKNSTHTWGEWRLVYDSVTLSKSVITGLVGDDTYHPYGGASTINLAAGAFSAAGAASFGTSSSPGYLYLLSNSYNYIWANTAGGLICMGVKEKGTNSYANSTLVVNQYGIGVGGNTQATSSYALNVNGGTYINGAIMSAGNITLANNKFIRWMSNPEGGASPEAIIALEFTTSNNLYIGYGVAASGHFTRLYGNTIDFLTGSTTRTTAFVLSDSNATMYRTFVPSINNSYDLGSSELKWGTLHANNGNFYNKVNVGAPSSTPAAVNVAGTIWASTGIWSDGYVSAGGVASSSDERLKANIKDFKYSAELLMSLKPREWDWNGKTTMVGHSAGFVAQEVEPHLPYAVTERTYKQLTYDIFHALEVSALQDHDTRIKALEDENRKKDAKIAALEKEIKQLRAL